MKIGFHKDIFKPSLLNSAAVFLVFVFAWTNLGIYQAVYAAKNSKDLKGSSSLPLKVRGMKGGFDFFSPLKRGDERGVLTSLPIQLASLTRKDKDWTAYQVRNDNNNIGDFPQSVIPVKTGIQRKENLDSVSSHGMTQWNNQLIQLASLTTDNLSFSFPPLEKGAGGFDNNFSSDNLPLKIRGGVPKRGMGRGFFDIESEKAGFQKEKSERVQSDINIRAQLKQTEARIKDLPSVIQQRQKAFEVKYEKNFKQLKAELDAINTAKTNYRFTTRKLKTFLNCIVQVEN